MVEDMIQANAMDKLRKGRNKKQIITLVRRSSFLIFQGTFCKLLW